MLQSIWNQRRTEPEASERHPESAQASACCTDRRSWWRKEQKSAVTQMDETVLPPRVSWLPRGETAGTTGAPSLPRARAPSCQQASPAESRGTPGPPIRPASGPVPPVPRAGWRGAAKGPHPTHRPPGGAEPVWAGRVPQGPCPHRVLLSQKLPSRQEHQRTTPQALTVFLDHVCVTSNPSESQGHWCRFCLHAED